MASSKPTGERAHEPGTRIVHWEDLFEVAASFIEQAEAPVILMTPFISPDVLTRLLTGRNVAVVVTSWRKDHLLQGVSSLATYPVTRSAGTKLLVNDRLHAKLITADFKDSLIGSANMTAARLGTCARPNLEAVVRVRQATPELKALFCRILIDARAIDDAVYARYVEWLRDAVTTREEDNIADPPRIESDPFLTSQLPATQSPMVLWTELTSAQALSDDAIHDAQLFAVPANEARDAFLRSLRPALRANAFIASLLNAVSRNGLYFGAFKTLVQRTCTDVLLPHHRELTSLVQNLYAWITEVFSDEFEVVQPHYSQLLRRIH